MNSELRDYLYNMITPTQVGGESLVLESLDDVDWGQYADASYHGFIGVGDPTPEQVEEIWRVVKPGAHVVVLSPSGYVGACNLEDKGFEIRDSFAIAEQAGDVFYTPKPSAKERQAGTEHLVALREQAQRYTLRSDVDVSQLPDGIPTEDALEVEIPAEYRDLFEPQALSSTYGNNHPTVKGRQVMANLLGDIPKGATVLDCFMGSGTTGISCMSTNHSFVGIEREADYLQIADARIKYWREVDFSLKRVEIQSEAPEVMVSSGTEEDPFWEI